MNTEIYITLTIIGTFLILTKDIFDVDILGGYNITSVISSAILMWGIVGLFGINEPWAGLVGGLFFGLLTQIFISAVVVRTDIEEEYTGKFGRVNMDIDPNHRGKIKVETDKTVEFFIATHKDPISKSIKTGTPVQIIDFDGIVANVRQIDRLRENKSVGHNVGILKGIYLFFRNLRRNGNFTCEICYSEITKKSQLISCPHCEATFHIAHWKQWLGTNNYCPVCREDVR